jgi:hypothetical protein
LYTILIKKFLGMAGYTLVWGITKTCFTVGWTFFAFRVFVKILFGAEFDALKKKKYIKGKLEYKKKVKVFYKINLLIFTSLLRKTKGFLQV